MNWKANYPVDLNYVKGIDNLRGWPAGKTPLYLYCVSQDFKKNLDYVGIESEFPPALARLEQRTGILWDVTVNGFDFVYILEPMFFTFFIRHPNTQICFFHTELIDVYFDFNNQQIPISQLPIIGGDCHLVYNIAPWWLTGDLLIDDRKDTGSKVFDVSIDSYYQVIANRSDKSYCLVKYSKS